ncbi:MAG: hypothetical protein ACI4TF_10055 [Oliverpabstia sp.]
MFEKISLEAAGVASGKIKKSLEIIKTETQKKQVLTEENQGSIM